MQKKFLEYKSDKDNKKYVLDLGEFKKFKDINENEVYQLSTCVEKRVRRWIETWMYERSQSIYFSNWTMDKLLFFY